MPKKISTNYNASQKALKMFIRLLTDGRKHFQTDLAEEYQCSPQSIGRVAADIESVIGDKLKSGIENRRRYYQIHSISRRMLPLEYEELRYIGICRDLAEHILPEAVARRVDSTLMQLSIQMADPVYADWDFSQKGQLSFFRKGHIDYSPHQATIERILQAIEEKWVCIIHYKAAGKNEAREHRVLPGKLISQNNALYLLGAILTPRNEQKNLTNMAIHRIVDVDLTDKRSDITLPQADPSAFGLPWHEPRQVRIQFQAGKVTDYVRERMWSVEQKIEDLPDGGIILEMMSQSDEELMAWVRGFGEKAQRLEEKNQ